MATNGDKFKHGPPCVVGSRLLREFSDVIDPPRRFVPRNSDAFLSEDLVMPRFDVFLFSWFKTRSSIFELDLLCGDPKTSSAVA